MRRNAAGLLIALLLILGSGHARAADTRRVLLIHAFGHPYSPWSDMAASFHTELIKDSQNPIDFYEVSLDTARVQDQGGEAPFVEYIHALVGKRKLDLVVPVGAPAAFFVQRHRVELFPETPMLVIGAELRRMPAGTMTEKDTGVFLDLDLPAYLENILRLLPETTNIGVVAGNTPVERYWASQLQQDSEKFSDRLKLEWFSDLTFAEMLDRASNMPPRSVIFWGMLSEDAAGVPYAQDGALEKMRRISSVPVFGIGDYEFGHGIIGGPLIPTGKVGQEASALARRIMNGESASAIGPPAVIPLGLPRYDWRELQRWGISESRLPSGSVVEFREPTTLERYRWPIFAVVMILLGQSALIAYVLFQGRRRRAAEAEAAEQRREVAHLMRVSVLGELSGAIAHEINQPLAAIMWNAEAAIEQLEQHPPSLAKIRDAIDDIVIEDSRAGNVITRLRDLLKKGERKFDRVDVNELITSTIELLNSELVLRQVSATVDLADDLPAVSGDPVQLQQLLINLILNAMDAMTSISQQQRRMVVRSRPAPPNRIEIRIRDFGPGIADQDQTRLFEPFFTSKKEGLGLGLTICSTIAQAHSGSLTLANHPDKGAQAVLSLPAN